MSNFIDWRSRSRHLVSAYTQHARHPLALIDIRSQSLYLIKDLHLCGRYLVSTSRYGVGAIKDSYKTPPGVHRVAMKIGEGEPLYRSFKARRASDALAQSNLYATTSVEDVICTRILWLAGLEAGINQGGCRDSERRYIYIHGTADEKRLGRPASIGCIRMGNRDVLKVFNTLEQGSLVQIIPPTHC